MTDLDRLKQRMSTKRPHVDQQEEFAFYADHSTSYRGGEPRHGHTWLVKITTSWRGDHATMRGIVGRAALSKLHKGYLNEIIGMPDGQGATVEAVAEWILVQLESTPLGSCIVEVTELGASQTFELLRHTKICRR